MAIEQKGPGGVSNSYGRRTTIQPVGINSAKPKDVYNEFDSGELKALLAEGRIAPPKAGIKIVALGDSRNARSSVPFPALGGWVKTVTAISAGGVDGTALVTFSAAHNIPTGQRVLFDPDATINSAFRNRWFNFTSLSATTGRISVPDDAYDRSSLIERIAAVSVPFSGSSQCLTIDAIQGTAGCLSEFFAVLGQPWDEVVNLCIPGATTADTLALIRTLDLSQFTHAYYVDGINDMATGVDPSVSLNNKLTALNLLNAAGVTAIVHDEHPQGTMDSTKQTWLRTYNTGLREYAITKGTCILVPVYNIVNDPTTNTGLVADLSDGTHWTAALCEKIGRVAAKVVEPFIKSTTQLILPISSNNYITNGNMSGITGTHTTPGAGAGQSQGQVATGWVVNTPGTNVTCTTRKVSGVPKLWRPGTAYALGDVVIPTYGTGLHYHCTTAGTSGASAPTWGVIPWATTADNTATWTASYPLPNLASRADWQAIQGVVAGTVTAQERVTLQQSITLASVGLAAGDWIRMRMRVHAYDSAWRNVMLSIRSGSTIDGLFSFATDGGKNSFVTPSVQPFSNREGILRTLWWQIPAGQTSLTAYLEGGLGTGSENSIIRLFVTEACIEKLT